MDEAKTLDILSHKLAPRTISYGLSRLETSAAPLNKQLTALCVAGSISSYPILIFQVAYLSKLIILQKHDMLSLLLVGQQPEVIDTRILCLISFRYSPCNVQWGISTSINIVRRKRRDVLIIRTI